MNTAIKVAVGASAFAATALLAPTSSMAATEHCPAGGTKVEVGGDSASRFIGEGYDGLRYCIKAGTGVTYGTVTGGWITNTEITNRNGTPLGISYYVVYGGGSGGSGGSTGGSGSGT